jgi:hypothetical protein
MLIYILNALGQASQFVETSGMQNYFSTFRKICCICRGAKKLII